MSKVQRFEDLVIWQKAMDIAIRIFELSQNLHLKKEWGIRDQVVCSSLSISSNINRKFVTNKKVN